MSNIDTKILFEQNTCYIQDEPKKGKVLAVATYHTHRRVCFRIEGEKWGTWVDENYLFSKSNLNKNKDTNSIVIPAQSNLGQNAIEKTLKFSQEIINRATKDVDYIVKVSKGLNASANKSIRNSLKYTDKQINNWLTVNLKGSVEVIKFIKSVVSELWNRYWRDRIVDSLMNKDFDTNNAQKIVIKLKQDYPEQGNYEIAQQLIVEKAIFATMTGLIKEVPGIKEITSIPIINQRVKFLSVKDLIVEIIHQIAFVYGYRNLDESELLAIFAIVFDKRILLKLDLQFLVESKIPVWEINAISNMGLFTIIGYATREFYETKTRLKNSPLNSEKEFMLIKSQVEEDSIAITTQKSKFEGILSKSMISVEQTVSI